MTPLETARNLLAFCKTFDGKYVYGGGHGPPLSKVTVHQGLDCSSSTSRALYHNGLLGSTVAQVSGWFETWGARGRGKYVTVHASADHVWVEFTLPEGWSRFDTSPHGSGEFGPRVRTGKRSDIRFVHRHPPGL